MAYSRVNITLDDDILLVEVRSGESTINFEVRKIQISNTGPERTATITENIIVHQHGWMHRGGRVKISLTRDKFTVTSLVLGAINSTITDITKVVVTEW